MVELGIEPPVIARARRPKSVLFVPLIVGGEATGVDLAPEPGPRARVQRGGRPAADHARRQPERRARERAAVRGDPAAQRRAGADQRRPAGLAENLEMQAMYDLVGERLAGDLRRAGRRHRHPRPADGPDPVPVLDRARVRLPDEPIEVDRVPQARARDAGAGRRQRRHAERGARVRAAGRDRRASRRSRRCSCRWSSAAEAIGVISLQNLDREHAFSDGDVRLLTTLAGEPERGARERAPVRGDPAAQRRARADQRRAARAGREPRDRRRCTTSSATSCSEIFDAQVVDIGIVERDADADPLPVHDRARRAVPGRADRVVGLPQAVLETRSHRAAERGRAEALDRGRPAGGDPGRSAEVGGVRAPRRRRARRPA